MSVDGDEDTELRDLVISSLKSSGVLGKLRANLRSNVYLALEGQLELQVRFIQTFGLNIKALDRVNMNTM